MIKLIQKYKQSLRRMFLTIIFLIYVITAMLTIVFLFFRTQAIRKDYVSRFAIAQNRLEKNRIVAIIDRELILSRKLADDTQIKQWMQDENNEQLRKQANWSLLSYHKFFSSKIIFLAVRKSHNYYINNFSKPDMHLKENSAEDRWFFDTIKSNIDYSLNVNYDTVLDAVKLWINVIVRDSREEALGVAGSGMDITEFLGSIVEHKSPGINTIIINKKGEIQAYKDRQIVEHNGRVKNDKDKITLYHLLKNPTEHTVLKTAIEKLDSPNSTVQLINLTLNKKKVLCALDIIPELGWINLVFIDSESIISVKEFLPFGFIFILSVTFILFSIYFIFNQLISKPLKRLTLITDKIANGSYDTEITIESNNEIGRLGKSFNMMSSEIKKYVGNLEDMVEKRTIELLKTNIELQESQKRVMDSIEYAKLIQNSILADKDELNRFLKESFILYKPLDIVGGDFYYIKEMDEGFVVCTVDCTGHGVPGAIMTMLVYSALDRALEGSSPHSSAEILQKLHSLVQESLKKHSDFSHLDNGFDIAFCMVNTANQTIKFSGAGLPFIGVKDKTIQEYSGESVHLGYKSTKKDLELKEKIIAIDKETTYFLITDGILDLPVGDKGYGMGKRHFKEILVQSYHRDISKYEEELMKIINSYQDNHQAKDDLLLMGFKL